MVGYKISILLDPKPSEPPEWYTLCECTKSLNPVRLGLPRGGREASPKRERRSLSWLNDVQVESVYAKRTPRVPGSGAALRGGCVLFGNLPKRRAEKGRGNHSMTFSKVTMRT